MTLSKALTLFVAMLAVAHNGYQSHGFPISSRTEIRGRLNNIGNIPTTSAGRSKRYKKSKNMMHGHNYLGQGIYSHKDDDEVDSKMKRCFNIPFLSQRSVAINLIISFINYKVIIFFLVVLVLFVVVLVLLIVLFFIVLHFVFKTSFLVHIIFIK